MNNNHISTQTNKYSTNPNLPVTTLRWLKLLPPRERNQTSQHPCHFPNPTIPPYSVKTLHPPGVDNYTGYHPWSWFLQEWLCKYSVKDIQINTITLIRLSSFNTSLKQTCTPCGCKDLACRQNLPHGQWHKNASTLVQSRGRSKATNHKQSACQRTTEKTQGS